MPGPDVIAAPPSSVTTPDIQAGPAPVEGGISTPNALTPEAPKAQTPQGIDMAHDGMQAVLTGNPSPEDVLEEWKAAAPPVDANAGVAGEQSSDTVATEPVKAQPLSPEQRQQQEVIAAQDAVMDSWTQDYLSQNGFSSITDMDTAAYDRFVDQQGKYVVSQRFRGELATELGRRRAEAEQQAAGTPPAEFQGGPVDQAAVAGEEQPAEVADTAEQPDVPAPAAEADDVPEDSAEPEQTPEQKQIKELQEQLAASNAKIDTLADQLTTSTENINKVTEQLAAANKTIDRMEVMIAKLGKALETDDLKLRKTTAKDVGLAILALIGKEAYDAIMDSVTQQVAAAQQGQPH